MFGNRQSVKQSEYMMQVWEANYYNNREDINLLEMDWPGSKDICVNLASLVLYYFYDSRSAEEVQQTFDYCLNAAINSYKQAMFEEDLLRYRIFVDTVLYTLASLVVGGNDQSEIWDYAVELQTSLLTRRQVSLLEKSRKLYTANC